MTRLIDADALKLFMQTYCDKNKTIALHIDEILDLITNAPTVQQSEPFGYFKAEPFGWTDCAETDEGAIALYEAPTIQREGWVSVEEGLPNEASDTPYLVRYGKNGEHYGTTISAYNYPRFSKNLMWIFEYRQDQYLKVTHWQPLPAAPTDTE